MIKKNTKSVMLRNRQAMTFVEILVAGFLMFVVFIIGWIISSSFSGVTRVRNYETAIFLTNQAVEAVRAARSRELGVDGDNRKNTLLSDFSSSDNVFDKNGEGFVPVIKIGNVEYRRTISIKDIPSDNKDLATGLKLIRVSVTWKSGDDGRPMVFEAVTTHSDQW